MVKKEVYCPICYKKHFIDDVPIVPTRGCGKSTISLVYALRSMEFCDECIEKLLEKCENGGNNG